MTTMTTAPAASIRELTAWTTADASSSWSEMTAMALRPAIADASTAFSISSGAPEYSTPTDVLSAIAIISLVIRSFTFTPASGKKPLGALVIIDLGEFDPMRSELPHGAHGLMTFIAYFEQ